MVELSFPLRVASLAVGKEPAIEPDRLTLGQRSVPTDVDHALPITFYGPRRTIRTISAASVLAGDISPDDIRNRIVVLGAAVSGGGDFSPRPFDRLLPGVEVISTAITHSWLAMARCGTNRFAWRTASLLSCCLQFLWVFSRGDEMLWG